MADHMRNRIRRVVLASPDLDRSLKDHAEAEGLMRKACSRRTALLHHVQYVRGTSRTWLGGIYTTSNIRLNDEQRTLLHLLWGLAHQITQEEDCTPEMIKEWLSLVQKMMGIETKRELKARLIAAKVRTRVTKPETREKLRYQYKVRQAQKDLAEILEED